MHGNIKVGDETSRAKAMRGRGNEYFLLQFAGAEDRNGGEFYAFRCAVKPLIETHEPHRDRVHDLRCGADSFGVV